jgi:hypothetical protein
MRLFVIFEQPFHRLVRDLPDLAERIREVLPSRPWLPTAPASANVAASVQSGEPS